jgi:hypothetical protein
MLLMLFTLPIDLMRRTRYALVYFIEKMKGAQLTFVTIFLCHIPLLGRFVRPANDQPG